MQTCDCPYRFTIQSMEFDAWNGNAVFLVSPFWDRFFFNLNTCAVSLWWIGVTRSRLKLLTRFFWRCAVPFMNFKLRTLWTAFCLCRFSLAVSLTNKRAHSPYVIQSTVLECWNAAVSWCKSTALCASLHSYDATRELISRMQIRNIVCEWKLL